MAGGLTLLHQKGEAVAKASSLPAVIISYHQAGVNLICHSFFICGQHYLYRQEEIKAKPPSIAKWLAAHTLIRGEKPQQKRHPFLPLLYHTIRRVSTWFVTRFFICGQHYLYRERANFLPTYLPSFSRFIASPLAKYSRASALSCSTCARSSSSPANLRSGRRNSINLTRMKRP